MGDEFTLTRRGLLKLTGAGLASIYLGGCSFLRTPASSPAGEFAPDFFPIDRTLADASPRAFSGDNLDRPHAILWDTSRYIASKGGMPEASEKVPVVIVGGGMSGLLSAYLLRDLNPLVLEQAPRLGGNSRAETWNGLEYSLGAAYFMEPALGTPLRKLMDELGVPYTVKQGDDPVVLKGKRIGDFWARKEFAKYRTYLHQMLNEHYPDLPFDEEWMVKLDRLSLEEKLRRDLGKNLHPEILSAVEHYCWSSFNARASEVSAAAGLNFLAAETGKTWVPPGGNAAVAEALARKLPTENLRTGALVFQVVEKDGKAIVSYESANGELRAVEASAVVMACPKFVAKKLMPQLEPHRQRAIEKIRYRSYLLANVLLKKSVRPLFYDLYLLGNEPAEKAGIVDAVLADFARPQAKQSVLTLYRAMPFEGGRSQIFRPGSYDLARKEFEQAIAREVLPHLGISMEDVVDIRLTRWGHPMPVADKGRIADGTIKTLREPFRDCIFFVEQDNWLLPALETAAHEAFHFAPRVAARARLTFT